jgi:hypothetical protein
MEVTEKQKQLLQRTTWLNENQKQAVSLLQTLSEEEVAELVGWVLPITVEVPSTNDVRQKLQARDIATTDTNIDAVVTKFYENMWLAKDLVERLIESAIGELEQGLKKKAATTA